MLTQGALHDFGSLRAENSPDYREDLHVQDIFDDFGELWLQFSHNHLSNRTDYSKGQILKAGLSQYIQKKFNGKILTEKSLKHVLSVNRRFP